MKILSMMILARKVGDVESVERHFTAKSSRLPSMVALEDNETNQSTNKTGDEPDVLCLPGRCRGTNVSTGKNFFTGKPKSALSMVMR